MSQYDAEQALEYVTRQGRLSVDTKTSNFFLVPMAPLPAHEVVDQVIGRQSLAHV